MADQSNLQWLPLDNAAKIYPAARRKNWSNVYRLSATLTEPVDPLVLQEAVNVTVKRFPSMAVRLRRGLFWYYLQQLPQPPTVRRDHSYPLCPMNRDEVRKCALRILAEDNRIAVEIFHSLTDGTGGQIFLKTLVAEYLRQKYGVQIPPQQGVLDPKQKPEPEEIEDCFPKYAGRLQASRKEKKAWHLSGLPEKDGFLHLTCFCLPVDDVLQKAHENHVSVTAFLTAVMMDALQRWQSKLLPEYRRKPIRVQMPVNLRRLFPSKTLRNFSMYTTPEILPRLGHYSFQEICQVINSKMAEEITQKQMSMKIAANVASEKIMAVRVLPLFLKNFIMKAVFNIVGESKICLSVSNLGKVELPEPMEQYVERLDFILGVQATAPYNCGVVSYRDKLYINFIRNTREPELERHFYEVLKDMGLPVQVQSNLGSR